MKAANRQKKIIELLTASKTPISGGKFSEMLGVSRQMIVHDVNTLRLSGYDVIPTHRGYVLGATPLIEKQIKVVHEPNDAGDELMTIIKNGGVVLDVYVDHDFYGKLSAPLNLFSEEDVKAFVARAKKVTSQSLMTLTSGYHYHTIRAENEEAVERIEKALNEKGYLVK